MKMFVANSTKQTVDFLYRVPEAAGLRSQSIPIGGQVQISGDLTREAIDYIINQHAKYGMVEAAEVSRVRDFSGLCYSIDKPVQPVKIEDLIRHNTGKLVEMGKKIRQEAAISANNSLEAGMDEAGGPAAPGVNKFEMSVVEENHDDRDEMPAIAEGIRISRAAHEEPAQRTQRRKR